MNSKGLSGGIYKPLSPEGIDTIHDASLTILEKTGITYEAGLEETVDLLAGVGATVDREGKRIHFPRELILDQVAKAPSQVVLYSRDGKNDLDLTAAPCKGHRPDPPRAPRPAPLGGPRQ